MLLLPVILVFLMGVAVEAQQPVAPPKIVRITIYKVRPGMAPQFEEFVKKAIEANKKFNSPSKWTGYVRNAGDESLEYTAVSVRKKWAEEDDILAFNLATGNLFEKAFGKAEAERLNKLFADSVISFRSLIDVERSDLSNP